MNLVDGLGEVLLLSGEPERLSLRKLMAVKSLGWVEQEVEVDME